VLDILAPGGEVELAADGDEAPSPERWSDALRRAEGLLLCIGERLTAEDVGSAPRLRAVASMSAGADHLALDALRAQAIPTATVGPVLAETTADLAFALVLAAARRLGEGERAVRGGTWQGWTPTYMVGREVHGQTLGILGMGRIGRAVARRGRAFAMPVLYHNRRRLAPEAAEGAEYRSLEALLEESDVLVSLLPSTAETRGLLGLDALSRMRPDSVLVNAGRGDTLDLEALTRLLAAGRFGGVGLDVFPREPLPADHPILAFERVVALPHLGSATHTARIAMAETAAQALVSLLAGRPLPAAAVRSA
jgi:glyoxylate reductase